MNARRIVSLRQLRKIVQDAVLSVPAHRVPDEVVRVLSAPEPVEAPKSIDPLVREHVRRRLELGERFGDLRKGAGHRAARELREWYEAERAKRDPSPKITVAIDDDASEVDS